MPKPSKLIENVTGCDVILLSPRSMSLAVAFGAALCASAASAQQLGGSIFTCVNARGDHVRSDRPIADCMDREQRVLRKDGSLQYIWTPPLTADERTVKDARDRRVAAQRSAQREAERADRLLMQRFPNESAHNRARDAALEAARAALVQSEERIAALDAERQPLLAEAEFYKERVLPAKLKHKFDAIDTAVAAQRQLIANQQAELVRVNALYDSELSRLRKLWAGAAPGSQSSLSDAAQLTPDRAVVAETMQR